MGARYVRIDRNLYRDTSNGRIQARVQVSTGGSGKYMAAMFTTVKEAKLWQAECELLRAQGKPLKRPVQQTGDDNSPEVTFGQFAERWLAQEARISNAGRPELGRDRSGALRPHTVGAYRVRLDNHLLPAFGKVTFGDLTHASIVSWITSLAEDGYAASTQQELLGTLRTILRAAQADGIITTVPMVRLRPIEPRQPKTVKRLPGSERRPLDWSEVADIVSCIEVHVGVAMWTQWILGLRSGELCGLKVSDIELVDDLDALGAGSIGGVVRLVSQRTRTADVTEEHQRAKATFRFDDVGWLKTHDGKREIPIPTRLARLLKRHLTTPDAAKADRHAFLKAVGTPYDPDSWGCIFRRATARANLGFVGNGEGELEWRLTPHFARTQLNTKLALLDVSGLVRSKILGHRLARLGAEDGALITENIYRVVPLAQLADAMSKLDRQLYEAFGNDLPVGRGTSWLSVTEAAEILAVDETTVRGLAADGVLASEVQLNPIRRGRRLVVSADSVAAYGDREDRPRPGELTTTEVARMLNVHPSTVMNWAAKGRIRARRVSVGRHSEWRIPRDEAERLAQGPRPDGRRHSG